MEVAFWDYRRNLFTATYKLYYKGDIVGFRLEVDYKIYDIPVDDYACFLKTYDCSKTGGLRVACDNPYLNLKYDNGYLVAKGDKKRYPDLNYNDMCFLTGTLVENSSMQLKMMYDDLNKSCFKNLLPKRVGLSWSNNLTKDEFKVKTGILDITDDVLTYSSSPIMHIEISFPLIASHPKVKEEGISNVVKKRLFKLMYRLFRYLESDTISYDKKIGILQMLGKDEFTGALLREGKLTYINKELLKHYLIPNIEESKYPALGHKLNNVKVFTV